MKLALLACEVLSPSTTRHLFYLLLFSFIFSLGGARRSSFFWVKIVVHGHQLQYPTSIFIFVHHTQLD